MVSNPFTEFIKQLCISDCNNYVRYAELYTAYIYFLTKEKKRIISKKAFSEALDREAILVEKNNKQINGIWISDRWVLGLSLKIDWKKLCDRCDPCDSTFTPISYIENRVSSESQLSHESQNDIDLYNGIDFTTLSKSPVEIFAYKAAHHKETDESKFMKAIESAKLKGDIAESPAGYIFKVV
jgi:hypothetical protein